MKKNILLVLIIALFTVLLCPSCESKQAGEEEVDKNMINNEINRPEIPDAEKTEPPSEIIAPVTVIVTNPVISRTNAADPEIYYFEDKYWLYVTEGRNPSVYSTTDLADWTEHPEIIDISTFPWITRTSERGLGPGYIWRPTIIYHNELYYMFFATNNIFDGQTGGIEVAVSERPYGPFVNNIPGENLLNRWVNGASPIDSFPFKDDDGSIYLYWGGFGRANVAKLNDSLTGFVPFDSEETRLISEVVMDFETITDDSVKNDVGIDLSHIVRNQPRYGIYDRDGVYFKRISPSNYTEGPSMLKHDGIYYFMWSHGSWMHDSYSVRYASSDSPFGPFLAGSPVLQTQRPVAVGAGNHGIFYFEPLGEWLIVYHKLNNGTDISGGRSPCIDRINFSDGVIQPVTATESWTYTVGGTE